MTRSSPTPTSRTWSTEVQTQLAAIPGSTFDDKAATTAVLTMQTRHLILDAVAQKEGITVSQGEIDAFLKNIVDTQFNGKAQSLYDNLVIQAEVPVDQVSSAARDQMIYDALLAKIASGVTDATARSTAFNNYMTTFVANIGVEVAPRYGTWSVFSPRPGAGRPVVRAVPLALGDRRPDRAAAEPLVELSHAVPGRLVLLATSPRVVPGLLSFEAWAVLGAADSVLVADRAHPLVTALRDGRDRRRDTVVGDHAARPGPRPAGGRRRRHDRVGRVAGRRPRAGRRARRAAGRAR